MTHNNFFRFLPACALFGAASIAFAQHAPVVHDPGRNLLNNGQPLPAETKWMLTGPLADRIGLVEVSVYEDAAMKHEVETSRWERTEWNTDNSFNVPMDKLLRGSSEYTIVIGFYGAVGSDASTELSAQLSRYLDAYIDESVEFTRNHTRLKKPAKQVMEELDQIVQQGVGLYRGRLGLPFTGFSQLVREKVDGLNDTKLSMAKFRIRKSEEAESSDRKIAFGQERLASIKALLASEVQTYLSRELMVLRDRAVFTDQGTEKTMNILSLNAGYGGIYNSGGVDDLSYGTAPYLGMSFPLGRRDFSSRFFSNSSISLGVFLSNTEDEFDREVSGPLIGRPSYLAYGYRVFRMIRFNAGGALMERTDLHVDGSETSEIYVTPFLGVSVEFNLWLGLGK